VALRMFAGQLRDFYEKMQLEPPEWLDTRIKELSREIKSRTADMLEKRLREAKARREALKPATERREEVDAEIKRLEEQLAGQP